MYNLGETVIVTERINKKEEKHSVGVIMRPFFHEKQAFYDVLLERRTGLSFLNTARSSKQAFINRDLTTKLVESGNIESTIPFKSMLDNEELPIMIA